MYANLAILALFAFFYSLVSGGLEKTPFNGAVVFTALPLHEEGLFISYGIQNARHVPILKTQRPDHLILVGQVAFNISLQSDGEVVLKPASNNNASVKQFSLPSLIAPLPCLQLFYRGRQVQKFSRH